MLDESIECDTDGQETDTFSLSALLQVATHEIEGEGSRTMKREG